MGLFKSKEAKEEEKKQELLEKEKEYNIDGLSVATNNELTSMSLLEKGATMQNLGSLKATDTFLSLISMQNKILIRLVAKLLKK